MLVSLLLPSFSLFLFFSLQSAIIPSTEDITISFLPLAHMFERVVQVRPRSLGLRPPLAFSRLDLTGAAS